MEAYQNLASVYDQFMKHAPYDKWVSFTEKMVDLYGVSGKRMVDLGCGTGEITLRLSDRGFDVTGVDISETMLAEASQKAMQQKKNIFWVQQDIRTLQGFENVDVCVSYCDVMNYVTEKKDIETVCQNVFHSLNKAGLFIFDIHYLPYVTEQLVDCNFSDVMDDAAYIWECEPGETEGEMHHFITFFARQGNGQYHRYDEYHHQQTYATDFYTTALEKAGFTKIQFYADFSTENHEINQDKQRIFILAEK